MFWQVDVWADTPAGTRWQTTRLLMRKTWEKRTWLFPSRCLYRALETPEVIENTGQQLKPDFLCCTLANKSGPTVMILENNIANIGWLAPLMMAQKIPSMMYGHSERLRPKTLRKGAEGGFWKTQREQRWQTCFELFPENFRNMNMGYSSSPLLLYPCHSFLSVPSCLLRQRRRSLSLTSSEMIRTHDCTKDSSDLLNPPPHHLLRRRHPPPRLCEKSAGLT